MQIVNQAASFFAALLLGALCEGSAADTLRLAKQQQPSEPTTAMQERKLSENLEVGKSVFTHKCVRCHATNRFGSPRMNDHEAWRQRLKQGEATLVEHAMKGHGLMPAKGGFRTLTDAEVAAAVSYVVSRARIYATLPEPAHSSPCAEDLNAPDCPQQERHRRMVLQILWLLGNPK